jgi:hypothetical protein
MKKNPKLTSSTSQNLKFFLIKSGISKDAHSYNTIKHNTGSPNRNNKIRKINKSHRNQKKVKFICICRCHDPTLKKKDCTKTI